MWWKKGTIVVLIIFLISVTWGIIYVYNDIPKSLIGNSKFKIYCSKKPFEVRIETSGYNVYLVDGKIFGKLVENVKDAASKIKNHKASDDEEIKTNNNENNDIDNHIDEVRNEEIDININKNDGD